VKLETQMNCLMKNQKLGVKEAIFTWCCRIGSIWYSRS